jgi:GT2 family glycosyltransferase
MDKNGNVKAVAVLIVTYGDRLNLIQKVVESVSNSPLVNQILIVDNGRSEPLLECHFESKANIKIIRSEYNLGSAGGFAIAIEEARKLSDVSHIAILDDDNVVSDGYFEALSKLSAQYGEGKKVAFSACRTDQGHLRTLLDDERKPEFIANSFLGFDVRSILIRKFKNLGDKRRQKRPVQMRKVSQAPYGGLFLDIDTVRAVDLPRADFLLYGDDHEYTRRITDKGVDIYLTNFASISDVDSSWTAIKDRGSRWIDGEVSPWRIYYAARNHHYLELMNDKKNVMLKVNRIALFTRLYLESLLKYKSINKAGNSLRVFSLAIKHAKQGQLGPHPEFRIPGSNY